MLLIQAPRYGYNGFFMAFEFAQAPHGCSIFRQPIAAARVACTRLVLNATQAALTVAKGTGFVVPHPAQRWAR